MPSDDVKKLGFKCGVEIHQQLLTDRKLFCRCPAYRYSKEHHAEVLRHMRPTLSEMGGYDGCALMEFKTKKEIVYLLNKESVCTYDMDDTPPFPINENALDIVIEISLLLNCSIVDELHIARKQYLDGSIPTGFQRSGIVGVNGTMPFGDGRTIRIRQISIEEDSCREKADEQHMIFFRTDRLGAPLIEVVTEADMATPEEAAEAVRLIGRLMRATAKVRRGLGAVRQDVNVSIAGGRRVEIKGVPRYQLIPALTRIEAQRQKALLDLRDEMNRRGIAINTLSTEEIDLTEVLSHTEDPALHRAIARGWRIRGIRLGGCAGLLGWPTQPGRTFASELAGRVRVIACLDQSPNIYHTDYYPAYAGSHIDYKKIRHHLRMGDGDAGVIVWGPAADAITGTGEIRIRMAEAAEGVPHETRQHLHGGLTDFERILPGADRMYPDTDHPPVRIREERVDAARAHLPERPLDVEAKLKGLGVTEEGAATLALMPRHELFLDLIGQGFEAHLVERVLLNLLTHLRRVGVRVDRIPLVRYRALFDAYKQGLFHREAFEKIIPAMAEDDRSSIEELITRLGLTIRDEGVVVAYARALIDGGAVRVAGRPIDVARRHLLKEVAARFRGAIPGVRIVEIVSRFPLA